jgi:hypothetical protein
MLTGGVLSVLHSAFTAFRLQKQKGPAGTGPFWQNCLGDIRTITRECAQMQNQNVNDAFTDDPIEDALGIVACLQSFPNQERVKRVVRDFLLAPAPEHQRQALGMQGTESKKREGIDGA